MNNEIALEFFFWNLGWTVRIYHNLSIDDNESWRIFESTFPAKHIDLCNATQIIEDRNLGDIFAMTWRWVQH